ncbi:hypothetical protein AMAG_13647 [Allomyces macrogynus ATCC 38327]|uniref:Uncharacterized protein n=2 Tax=Allomyces macrogynus (strain ATCC 38327) TaxID=578462 RepID=A0A0L0T3X8_ALLM3|nr:hypothetical protein AMAG_13647 [Allomyces macrogynus ATCC 38327]|eukprot:KNE69264.1 hypothetical protein AMAG_13647 [Allomyces macrogynus ATCC 38327]
MPVQASDSAATTPAAGGKTALNELTNRGPGQARGFVGARETLRPVDLQVFGTVPSWLEGALYRIGPSKFTVGDVKIFHWFDGLSMVHRFEIRDGKVQYRSRETSKDVERVINETGGFLGIAQSDPCSNLFKRVATTFMAIWTPQLNKAPINVTVTPNFPIPSTTAKSSVGPDSRVQSLVAKTDYNGLQVLDPMTLEVLPVAGATFGAAGKFTYENVNPDMQGTFSMGHHQWDPSTGDIYNVVITAGPVGTYRVIHVNPTTHPDGRVLTEITHSLTAYLHSFSLTRRYLVLMLQPYAIGWMGLKAFTSPSYLDSLQWYGDHMPTTFYVIDRESGAVEHTFDAAAFFFFHTCNAWDVDDDEGNASIVLEVCAMDTPVVVRQLNVPALNPTPCPQARDTPTLLGITDLPAIRRYTLPLPSDAVPDPDARRTATFVQVSPRGVDLPRFHSARAGTPTRFVYGIISGSLEMKTKSFPSSGSEASLLLGIGKFDTERKMHVLWHGKQQFPGEPVFVPRPGAVEEDDGVVVTVVLDGDTGKSYLLVLDAASFTEIGRASMPTHVPFGFHGSFVGAVHAEMDSFN